MAVLFAEVPQFYARVERADDPGLRERPLIVGGDPRKRGLVQSATPDALAAGVRVDMSVAEALALCPRARALPTNLRRYREVSRRLFARLREAFVRLEASGLGAAYVSLPGATPELAARFASVVAQVRDELDLPLRGGVASGKFVARMAAARAAEGELVRVPSGAEAEFLAALPVAELEGVGQKTAAILAELGAQRIGDLVRLGRDRLEAALGNHGRRIYALASGRDEAPVRAAAHARSLSRESRVSPDVASDLAQLQEVVRDLARRLEEELRAQRIATSRIVLKLRFAESPPISRSATLAAPTAAAAELARVGLDLLARGSTGTRALRGVGLQLARLSPAAESDRQLGLFESAP
jgi:DNA polymerase-4